MSTNFQQSDEARSPVQRHKTGYRWVSSKTVAGIGLSCLLLVWIAWTLLHPMFPAKPAPLVLNGTWTVLSKAQPLGRVSGPLAVAIDGEGALYVDPGDVAEISTAILNIISDHDLRDRLI